MDDAEALDMSTMCEALKIADQLERTAAHLKELGSNPAGVVEPPSMDARVVLPPGSYSEKPYVLVPNAGSVPIGLILEEARDEAMHCYMRLDELAKHWFASDQE